MFALDGHQKVFVNGRKGEAVPKRSGKPKGQKANAKARPKPKQRLVFNTTYNNEVARQVFPPLKVRPYCQYKLITCTQLLPTNSTLYAGFTASNCDHCGVKAGTKVSVFDRASNKH